MLFNHANSKCIWVYDIILWVVPQEAFHKTQQQPLKQEKLYLHKLESKRLRQYKPSISNWACVHDKCAQAVKAEAFVHMYVLPGLWYEHEPSQLQSAQH